MNIILTESFTDHPSGKKHVLPFYFLFLLSFSNFAQPAIQRDKHGLPLKSTGFYVMAYLKTETLPFNNNKSIMTRFPYVSNDTTTGLTTIDTFKIGPASPFRRRPVFTNINLELVKNNNCFNMQVILAPNYLSPGNYGGGFSLGYGRTLKAFINKKEITLKAYVNSSVYSFRTKEGSIDNHNKYVTALGSIYKPSYGVTTHSKYSTHYSKYDASSIGVYYKLSYYTLSPQITIANNKMQKIYWSLNFGWIFSVYNDSGMELTGSGENNDASFSNSNLNIYVNGEKTRKFPYKLNGCLVGFSIGMYLNR